MNKNIIGEWKIETRSFNYLKKRIEKDEIQRDYVWKKKGYKDDLLDSINRKFPIGVFLAIKEKKNNKTIIKIYDGWQRFCTISEFIKEKKYKYLEHLQIPILFYTGDSKNITEIFRRVNLNSIRLNEWDKNNIFLDQNLKISREDIEKFKYKEIFDDILEIYTKKYQNLSTDSDHKTSNNKLIITTKIFLISIQEIAENHLVNITKIQPMFQWQILHTINPNCKEQNDIREWLENLFRQNKYTEILEIFSCIKLSILELEKETKNIFYYCLNYRNAKKKHESKILKTYRFSNNIIYFVLFILYIQKYEKNWVFPKNLNISKLLLYLALQGDFEQKRNFAKTLQKVKGLLNAKNLHYYSLENINKGLRKEIKKFFKKQIIDNYGNMKNIPAKLLDLNRFFVYKLSFNIFAGLKNNGKNNGAWNNYDWTLQHNPSQNNITKNSKIRDLKNNIGVLECVPKKFNSSLGKNSIDNLDSDTHNISNYEKKHFLYRKYINNKDFREQNLISHINNTSINNYWCDNKTLDLLIFEQWG